MEARLAQPVTADIPVLRGPGTWQQRAGKYAAIFRMSVTNQFAYIGEQLIRAIFLVLIIFIFVQLWTVTYGVVGTPRIGNYTLAQMVWYFAFAEAIIFAVPLLRRKVDDDVKSGEIAYRLSKPYHYILYLAADYAGEWVARFAVGFAVGVAMALIMVGPIAFSIGGVVATLVVLVLASTLDFTARAAISLLSFWIEDTMAINLIYSRLVMLLGGMMIPLDVFPEPLSSIARALPFSYMVYGPSRMWVAPTPQLFISMLPGLLISLLAGVTIVWLLFRAGRRNVTVNGG